MTDAADFAGPIEQREREAALARQAARNEEHETPFEIEGMRVCTDCYEPIGARRLEANPHAVRCTECQQDLDRRRARGMA
jgi:phage/conjugal plasmid C-4 type zinc finger TraR family protein